MQLFVSWFLVDPRRICVVGVWLYLVGLVTTAGALIAGPSLEGLAAGMLLISAGTWAKVAGRDRFRRRSVWRHAARARSRVDALDIALQSDTSAAEAGRAQT